MTFIEANRTIRDAVAARMAGTPADDPKMVGYQPPECPGCEGSPFHLAAKQIADQAVSLPQPKQEPVDRDELARNLPPEFLEATKNITFSRATPVPPAEFKIERIGSSIPAEHLEAAWSGIKARRDEMMAKIKGKDVEPLKVVEYPYAERVKAMRTTRLIGLTGPAGCGKNLVASMIPDAVVIQLADPLYAALSVMLGIPETLLRSRAGKERVIDWIGKSPRQMLQTLGTEWGRQKVSEGIWLTLASRRIDELQQAEAVAVAIADVRFDNEAQMIRDRGGEVWSVMRTPASETYAHVSETGISSSLVDLVIDNTGTPEETRDRVIEALSR